MYKGCPCGACGTCGACGASGACATGPARVEGLEHLALDLPYLNYIISNLCFNYDSSIIVLFYSSCVTLSPCFYFISCPLLILVMFIYSLFQLSSFPSIYILIPHLLLQINLLQFILFYFYSSF